MSIATKKWLEIIRFELVFQLGRKSTWFFFALFMIPLIGVTREGLRDSANSDALFNAPLTIAEGSVIWSLVSLLILAAVAGDAATRDVQTRMAPLMHTAPVGRGAYVVGRFIGAFLVAAMLLTVVSLVQVFAGLLHPGVAADLVGPFRPAAHLQSYFLLMLPTAFATTALMFVLAMLVRHTLGSYAGAALLFAGMQLTITVVAERLGHWELATLLDPMGLVALEAISRTWSPIELNERLAGTGALLWNRLLWLAIASALLMAAARRFDFSGNAGTIPWWRRSRLRPAHPGRGDAATTGTGGISGAAAPRSGPISVPHAPRQFGTAARVRQTLAITHDSLREVSTVLGWLVLPGLALRITGHLNALDGMGAGTMVLPTTGLILAPIDDDAPPPFVLAMLMVPVLIAGELIWRERDANLQALTDATPVPDGVRFVGKLLSLCLVFIAVYSLQMVGGVFTQVLRGWYDFDLPVYFQILGLRLVKVLVFALFAMSVHVLINQKHVGHLLTMALVLGPLILAEAFRIEHPLLLLGYVPAWRHSPISGFGPVLGSVLWFQLYWVAGALLLALVARLFWVRGVERGVGERLRVALSRVTPGTAGALAAAIGLVLLVGGFIFYNTNILNDFQTNAEGPVRAAEYERQYSRYRRTPQPRMTATVLDVELYPERGEADVRGVHRLVNRTTLPIDTIHVAISSEVETGDIEFDRSARAALLDDDLGHRVYALAEPLQPGDSLQMSWQVRHAPRGFTARGVSTAVVENGSFITMDGWMPLIGYQLRRELADAGSRREHGLPERPAIPSLYDVEARSDTYGRESVDLEVTVGTAAGQTAVAPGELLRTWTEGDRSYFQYATDAPIGLGYALFSAEYEVRKARWGDVALEVVHHPDHDLNVDRVIRGMQASLEQLSARFGPYPYKVLRFVEYPGAGGSLHASASTIWYLELFSLFDPEHEPRRLDLPFAVTGHEVAHQWWGGQGARVEGIAVLSESLAWYSAMGVVEEEYGTEHLERLLAFMRESYLDLRPRAGLPLLRASDSFLAYREGPFAMYALREYVGEENVDVALRRFKARVGSPEPPFATTLDLYAELQAVTPDSLGYLLADLFERNTFWELQARQATVQQTSGGAWQVSIDVEARKVAVDTLGVETDQPMDDLIEIGVYAPAEDGESTSRPLYLEMHRVRTGPQTITITVPERPARAGIDPRHLLIDVAPRDNLVDVPDSPGSSDGGGQTAAVVKP